MSTEETTSTKDDRENFMSTDPGFVTDVCCGYVPASSCPAHRQLNERELDALIAEGVMGFEEVRWIGCERLQYHNVEMDRASETGGRWHSVVPRYSTDIASAMLVRDKIASMPFSVRSQFNKALYRIVCERLGAVLDESELVLRFTARDVCEAAIEATKET